VAAIHEAPISEPNLANLGITHEWLVKNHDAPPDHYQGGPQVGASNQQALFQQKFQEESFISRIVTDIYKHSFHTDDYPSVSIRLVFDDGSVLTAISNSQQPFMLPWKIENTGIQFETYNANISRALLSILPKKTVNLSRINGDGLLALLKSDAARKLEPETNALDADNRAGTALAKLREHYSVLSTEINRFHHPEYGIKWSEKQPYEENLHVELKRPEMSAGVSDVLVLLVKDGEVVGVDSYLQNMGKYEELFNSVPWLVQFARTYGSVPVRISFVHDKSFGDKALQVFSADMRAIGKQNLADEAKAQQDQIALLIAGMKYAEAYWLVFPDKRVLLWRYNGPSGLLNWKPNQLNPTRCSDYQIITGLGGCVGSWIDADGTLQP
jgi:hypothetical protein